MSKEYFEVKYGKESKIVNVYVDGIMSLPSIYGANPNKVSQFYDKIMLKSSST